LEVQDKRKAPRGQRRESLHLIYGKEAFESDRGAPFRSSRKKRETKNLKGTGGARDGSRAKKLEGVVTTAREEGAGVPISRRRR